MSFSDVIGQVDQIVQWEQQLSNPAAATQSSGTAAVGTSDTSPSDPTSGASFSNALAQAQAQDAGATASVLDPSAATTGATSAGDLLGGGDSQLLSALQSTAGASTASGSAAAGSSSTLLSTLEAALPGGATAGTSSTTADALAASSTSDSFGAQATSVSDPRIQSMIQEADSLVGKPYVWGGGHNNFGPQSGYDCSGFVSAVLHAGGYLTSPQDTETLPTAAGMQSGPGQYVTVYDRTTPGQEGHVIMEIDGQFYESGGEQGTWGGGGGVQKISTPSAAYLSTFNLILHPAGL
jgi:cell wall-associated NlpC family hydrolase